MQFKQYTKRILRHVKGRLPTVVFIWYIALVVFVIMTVTLVAYGYGGVYDIVYGTGQAESGEEYEPVLDVQKLEDVLEAYQQ